MNVSVISPYPYPFGLAASNRINAYTKGLTENGCSVKVYLPFPGELSEKKKDNSEGIFRGVKFCYTSGRYKSNVKILRGFAVVSGIRKFWGYFTTIVKIYKDNRNIKFDILILSYDSILFLFIFSHLAMFIGAKSIFIFDEYPTPIRHKLKEKIPKHKEIAYKLVLKNISAYVSISEKLREYYCNLCPKETFILTTITDIEHFNITDNKYTVKIDNKFICYMGNMELAKDNVDLIIKAFSLISCKYPSIELHLYGAPDHNTLNYLKELIIENNMQNKIKIKGKVSFNDVPSILKQASILVSSQPDTKRASGGFPTKLGEYLATGTPIILTNVGENSKAIKDNIHVFFTKPDNYYEFAKKMEFVLNNYDEAIKVGQKGKEFLVNNYSTKQKGKELLFFINKIVVKNER